MSFPQYSQVRENFTHSLVFLLVSQILKSIQNWHIRFRLFCPVKSETDFFSSQFVQVFFSERVSHIITLFFHSCCHSCPSCEISSVQSKTDFFFHIFRKNGLIVRNITLWATNFSPPMFCATNCTRLFIQKCYHMSFQL